MATYEDILGAVESEIEGLSLTNIDAANVVKQKILTNKENSLPAMPGIVIAPFGSKTTTDATNLNDDITFPVLVALLRAGNEDQSANRETQLDQQEDIEKHFRNQRLAGVTSVYTCRIANSTSYNVPAWFDQYDATTILLNFISREARG